MAELNEGDRAPTFSLPSTSGKTVSTKDLKGQTTVIYFYPKDMTSGCTKESCDFRDSLSRLKKKGVTVYGISKDSIERHHKFIEKEGLNFELLSDESGEACKSFGVWKQKSLYGRKYMGIERSTFIIGPDLKIKKAFHKVKVPGHVDQILESV